MAACHGPFYMEVMSMERMVYPGTEVEVKASDWAFWKYVVVYRYKPEVWGEVKYSTYGADTPEELIEKVHHVRDCDCIMDYVGSFRMDRENHRVIPVEVRLAV